MKISIPGNLRDVVSFLEDTDGDVTTKYRAIPNIKPPRRNSPVKNKSNREDYMQKYMQEYREDGKDYQKVPEKVKEFRKEQRRKLKEL